MRAGPVIDAPPAVFRSRPGDELLSDLWPHLPCYAKVYAALATALRAGEFAPGTALPPRRMLCDQYGVSRITIAQATRMLVKAGLVQTARRGRALRVTSEPLPPDSASPQDLRTPA